MVSQLADSCLILVLFNGEYLSAFALFVNRLVDGRQAMLRLILAEVQFLFTCRRLTR